MPSGRCSRQGQGVQCSLMQVGTPGTFVRPGSRVKCIDRHAHLHLVQPLDAGGGFLRHALHRLGHVGPLGRVARQTLQTAGAKSARPCTALCMIACSQALQVPQILFISMTRGDRACWTCVKTLSLGRTRLLDDRQHDLVLGVVRRGGVRQRLVLRVQRLGLDALCTQTGPFKGCLGCASATCWAPFMGKAQASWHGAALEDSVES